MAQLGIIKQWAIFAAVLFAVCVSGLSANEAGVNQALVLYDSNSYDLTDLKSAGAKVSKLVEDLKEKHGFEVTVKAYADKDVTLFVADAPRYNHLVLLPSSKKAIEAKEGINQHELVKFINSEGNVLVVENSGSVLPGDVRGFLNELGIHPAPKSYRYIDHFNTKKGVAQLSNDNIVSKRIFGEFPGGEHGYEGTGALISNNENLFPIVRCTKTGLTGDGSESTASQDKTWTFGEQGFLAVGFQALNNARVSWVGSESLLNDEVASWTFQEKNVLKLQFVQHMQNDKPELQDSTLYRIKDQVVYTIGVSEYVDNKWVPYVVSDDDDQLQIAFKMLDPYQRLNLQPLGPGMSKEDGAEEDLYIYYANFTIPDQHGIFTFDLDYRRAGLSYLNDKRIVSVRHLANDEYKRSWEIPNAWFYVASAILVVIAWLAFVVNFLYIGNTNITKKNV